MSPEAAVKQVNSFFKYESDGSVDRWAFKSPGDCENYALLVLKEIAGSQRKAALWLLTGKAYILNVRTADGQPHAVLEYEGRFVDNRFKKWVASLDDLKLAAKPRKRYSKPQVLAELGFGAFFGG
jgi:predicted transglutaminase-like cysteine proteinase